MASEQKPNRQHRIDPSGQQQHWTLADKTERRRLAWTNGDAVRLDLAQTRKLLHGATRRPVPVPPTAIMASVFSSASAAASAIGSLGTLPPASQIR